MFDKIKKAKDDHVCDKALIEISEGNKEALSVIYRLYGKMIFSVAFQILNNYQDAEDVLQDVMLCISNNASKYQLGTNPRAWVMAMTRNLSLNMQNRKRDTVPYETLEDHQLPETALFETQFRSVLISDALDSLSDDERLIVKLKLYIGLSHAEIASVMSVTQSCAEKRYERALKKVRDYFCKGE